MIRKSSGLSCNELPLNVKISGGNEFLKFSNQSSFSPRILERASYQRQRDPIWTEEEEVKVLELLKSWKKGGASTETKYELTYYISFYLLEFSKSVFEVRKKIDQMNVKLSKKEEKQDPPKEK
jgi:hypothetical protein